MKKIWKVVASTLAMAFCFTGLFACDGDDKKNNTTKGGDGVIGGKYTEVTSEKQKETFTENLAKIDGNALLGDTDAADWARGLSFTWKNEVSYACGQDNFNTKGNGALNMYVANGTEGYDFTAAIDMAQSLVASEPMAQSFGIYKGTGDAKVELKEKIYFDMANLYFDTALTGENSDIESIQGMINGKKKMAVQDIVEVVMMFMNGPGMGGPEGSAPMAAVLDPEAVSEVAMILGVLDAYKVEVSADYSDGLKIKLETSDETWDLLQTAITGLLGQQMGGEMLNTVTSVLGLMELDMELYVHIAKSGELKAVAMNVEAEIDTVSDTDTESDGEKVNFKVDLSFNLTVNDKKVTLPENIATDTNYEYVDIKALVEGLMSGEGGAPIE